MGKTFRKNPNHRSRTYDAAMIAMHDCYRRGYYGYIRVAKTPEEHARDQAVIDNNYEAAMKVYAVEYLRYHIRLAKYMTRTVYDEQTVRHLYDIYEPRKPVHYKTTRYKLVSDKTSTFEKFVEREYDNFFEGPTLRDGVVNTKWCYGSKKDVFRKMCSSKVRSDNRKNVRKIIKGDDEDIIWCDNKTGKQYIRSVW